MHGTGVLTRTSILPPDIQLGRRHFQTSAAILAGVLCLGAAGCGREQAGKPRELTVAAAANLNAVLEEIGKAFTLQTQTRVLFSYASTAQLTQQIKNGAPFDLFLAADTEHVDQLIEQRKVLPDSRAIFARGRLVLWVPPESPADIRRLEDLLKPGVRMIAAASPGSAPYGRAAVETLKAMGLWRRVERKIVYANNVNLARQYAASGNAEAAFTAYSLVLQAGGHIVEVDPANHHPLEQALGIVTGSPNQEPARRFVRFLQNGEGAALLEKYGYGVPGRIKPHR